MRMKVRVSAKVAGICGLIFTLGLPWNIKRKMGIAGVVFFRAGMISLIIIGAFPKGTFLHRYVSIDFYLLGLNRDGNPWHRPIHGKVRACVGMVHTIYCISCYISNIVAYNNSIPFQRSHS